MTTTVCSEHANCTIHKTLPECVCICWDFDSQCAHTYTTYEDGRPLTPTIHSQTVQLEKSNGGKRELGNNYQLAGYNNQNTAKKVRYTTNTKSRKTRDIQATSNTTKTNDNSNTQLFIHPRTPEKPRERIPNIGQKRKWKTQYYT